MNAQTRRTTIDVQVISGILFCGVAFAAHVSGAERDKMAAAGVGKQDAERLVLHVPATDSNPVIDGRLDEPCWKKAAATGTLKQERGGTLKSTTKAFVLRDDAQIALKSKQSFKLQRGDRLVMRTGGGAGYGSPAARAKTASDSDSADGLGGRV